MRVVVATELPDATLEQIRGLAAEVTYVPGIRGPELRQHLPDVGILVVRGNRVSADTISSAPSLQMIIHAGSGTGDIDIEEASAAGIFVAHCPDQHATAVAELTLGLMIALDRRIVDNVIATREGRWIRTELSDATGLAGRTLGILGYGEIGRRVAQRARAFDMRVAAWTPQVATHALHEANVEFCTWPRELARLSDIVTVHAVGEDEDEREIIVDEDFLASLPEGASLVHVGHPGAVDRAALGRAVQERGLRVAADVFTSEPAADTGRVRFKLAELPGVICTQHIGPLTRQARQAVANEVLRIIRTFLVSGEAENCLNLCERSPATWQLVLRVRDQVGVMASILEAVRADGINAEEITSRVFTGAKAAFCTIALDERPSTEALEAIRDLPDVLHLELRAVV